MRSPRRKLERSSTCASPRATELRAEKLKLCGTSARLRRGRPVDVPLTVTPGGTAVAGGARPFVRGVTLVVGLLPTSASSKHRQAKLFRLSAPFADQPTREPLKARPGKHNLRAFPRHERTRWADGSFGSAGLDTCDLRRLGLRRSPALDSARDRRDPVADRLLHRRHPGGRRPSRVVWALRALEPLEMGDLGASRVRAGWLRA